MSTQPPSRPDDERLADLLDGYLVALQSGSAPSREEFVARHPEFEADLRHCLSSLDLLHAAARLPEREPAPAAEPAGLGVLGDFRIIREIARGGMGVVYEAQQLSLGRRVALKVLPFATTLDAKQLRRFQHEAQAAAQLHHSNIVPVFAVGCERGTHFYAMQYIDGRSLASMIAEMRELARKDPTGAEPTGPSAATSDPFGATAVSVPLSSTPVPRGLAKSTEQSARGRDFYLSAARLGVQAAEALAYAHEQGVVHRDVKPDNLLVDAHGNLWVTDFGLAQVQNNANLTLTGDLVGTLRYMSPEQALAKRVDVDHRTDLYSLGATLYELATLEYAFDGRDREELLRQIAFEEPRPPRRMRRGVPAELETIILKAMRKNPAERYATAREMADDLRRFLDDRPIQARRPTPFDRLAKWCRRNRAAVLAAAAVAAVVAGAWLVSNTLVARARYEADLQRRIADYLRYRANVQARTARGAVDLSYDQVEEWLDDRPPAEPARRDVLKKVMDFYAEFARVPSDEPDARFETATASLRAGRIARALDQRGTADKAYQECRAVLEGLMREFPAEQKYRAALAEVCRRHGQVADRQPADQQVQLAREGLALADYLVREAPAVPAYSAELAASKHNLGAVLVRVGRPADAKELLKKAADDYKNLSEDFPTESRYRHALASAQYGLATAHFYTNHLPDAEHVYRNAIDVLEQLAGEFPTRSRHRELLATSLASLGNTLTRERHLTEAGRSLERARDLRERLAGDFPAVAAFKAQLADAHEALAHLARDQHKPQEARGNYERALELRTKLAHDPNLTDHSLRLVQLRLDWSAFLLDEGRSKEADKAVKEGIAFWRRVLKLDPEQTHQCPMLESLYQTQARVYLAMGKYGEAARLMAEQMAPEPMVGQSFWERAVLMMKCARQAGKDSELPPRERPEVARDYKERARQLVGRAQEKSRTSPHESNELAWRLTIGADEDLRDAKRAVELAQAAVTKAPAVGEFWNTLGAAKYRAGDWASAREVLEKSCKLRNGGDGFDWLFLAMTCKRLGQPDEARKWYDKARKWYDQAVKDKDRRLRDSDLADLERLGVEAARLLGVPCQFK